MVRGAEARAATSRRAEIWRAARRRKEHPMKRLLIALLAALVIAVPAQAASSSVVTVSTTATQVVAAGAGQTVLLQNVGTAVIFCGFSSAVTIAANYFVALKAGAVAADGSGGSVVLTLSN